MKFLQLWPCDCPLLRLSSKCITKTLYNHTMSLFSTQNIYTFSCNPVTLVITTVKSHVPMWLKMMVADSQEAADCDNVTRYTSPYPPKKRNLQNPRQEPHLVGRHIIKDMSLATIEYSQKLSSGWWWTLPAAGHQKNKMRWPSGIIPCYKLLIILKGQCAKICKQWAPTKLMDAKHQKHIWSWRDWMN